MHIHGTDFSICRFDSYDFLNLNSVSNFLKARMTSVDTSKGSNQVSGVAHDE